MCKTVVALGTPRTDWKSTRSWIEDRGRTAIAEVNTREAARHAVAAAFDRLVLSGREAGGWVGPESTWSFLLGVLDELGEQCSLWVRGGLGAHAAAACLAAGAAGVVLEGALLHARESAVPQRVRNEIAAWQGAESAILSRPPGPTFRGYPAYAGGEHARRRDWDLSLSEEHGRLESLIGWAEDQIWPVGDDAVVGARLAKLGHTVGGIIHHCESVIERSLRAGQERSPFEVDSSLAQSFGTRFPIVQRLTLSPGSVTERAASVAQLGALPVVAVGTWSSPEAQSCLRLISNSLGHRPWGIALRGSAPAELSAEFLSFILEVHPPVAFVDEFHVDALQRLEAAGISVYSVTTTPGGLDRLLQSGRRQIVLSSAPRSDALDGCLNLPFVDQAITIIGEAIQRGMAGADLSLLVANGVINARSAAGIATLVAPLAELGVRTGVILADSVGEGGGDCPTGPTDILCSFAEGNGLAPTQARSREALDSIPRDQANTGVGQQTDRNGLVFANYLEHAESDLKPSPESTSLTIGEPEAQNSLGASGATERQSHPSEQAVDPEQLEKSVAKRTRALARLYEAVSGTSAEGKSRGTLRASPIRRDRKRERPSDVAIVGMAALVPGADSVRRFWQNSVNGVDAITEVPADRWDASLYYSPDPKAHDKIISRWGGFVPDITFDPITYGMPPSSLPSIEPLHLLTLETVRAALDDAGYAKRSFPRDRTAVVLGAGGGAAQLAMGYAFRSYLPLLDTIEPGLGTSALEKASHLLPEWTEDSFPGILLNVAAGRVANRFDLGGANYTVDAACGSSLAAAALAVRELECGAADMVVLGGVDTVQNPFTYLAFSKTHAFSPRGRCRPFDSTADGIVISEAVAVVVLKRLADAERDGDRIYAVLKGLGASSDGRAKGLTAPRLEGQIRALSRAYEKSGISPASVEYVEAHGTGTAAGDQAEVQALERIYREAGTAPGRCGLGSVKSQIGHTKCAAGLAGLINATLALHHRVYPPTIGIERPTTHGRFSDGPFHLSRRARPWLSHDPLQPRRAAVSAFGFGGTNFHAVLEAYEGDYPSIVSSRTDWDAELLLWESETRDSLLAELDRLHQALSRPHGVALREIAHHLSARLAKGGAARAGESRPAPWRLAIVAHTVDDALSRIGRVLNHLRSDEKYLHDPAGIELGVIEEGTGKVAVLFPGQGSQYPGMLEEIALAFPTLIDTIEEADRALARRGRPVVGPRIFPPTPLDASEAQRHKEALAATEVAQPALGAVSVGIYRLLERLGLRADLLAGHSYGELVALHVAGVMGFDELIGLSDARGRFLLASCDDDPGGMTALAADAATAELLIDGREGVVVANRNGPRQTVVAGPRSSLAEVAAAAQAGGIRAQVLPVACGFHSPRVASARGPLERYAASLRLAPPDRPVLSNLNGSAYPADRASIARRIGEHAVSSVDFERTITNLYASGARIFVEVGPGQVLTGLVGSILGTRPHSAVTVDPSARRGIAGFLHSLARLFVAGVPLQGQVLTEGRSTRSIDWTAGAFTTDDPPLSATTWLVNGTRARPIHGPEPNRLGAEQVEKLPVSASTPSSLRDSARPKGPLATGEFRAKATSAEAVFSAFQQTMRNFLDLQRDAMLRLLQDERPPSESSGEVDRTPTPNNSAAIGATVPPDDAVEIPPRMESAPDVERKLMELVRDRTGYPIEMLELDHDLEADLGIDSIKRVEILGSLRDALPNHFEEREPGLMEGLARARTLKSLIQALSPKPGPARPLSNGSEAQPFDENMAISTRKGSARPSQLLRRMVVEPVDAPLGEESARLVEAGTIVLTGDPLKLGSALATSLRRRGFRVVRLSLPGQGSGPGSTDAFEVDFHSPTSIAKAAETVRRLGPVTALIHALPFLTTGGNALESSEWKRRVDLETFSLIHMAREFGEDLALAAKQRGAAILALTAMGGGFASIGKPSWGWFPGQGAIAGLMKTLAREWPEIRVRAVDLDPDTEVPETVELIHNELLRADEHAEVGYLGDRRIALDAVERPLDLMLDSGLVLRPGEPVLITGGARGITASVAADLARRWQPRLLLLGTSPLPEHSESVDTRGVDQPSELKRILLEGMRRGGKPPSVSALEQAYQRLRRSREIRSNLNHLRALGAEVDYRSVDVRDESALREVVNSWRGQYGPPVGFIHGAGVIHDKLLRDKSIESAREVVATKLDGAIHLVRLLDASPPRFTVFFSSIAGRFGNVGQSDYAAANDALNKLAIWLDDRWPGRVVSMNWGPWSGLGMVSDLESHLGRRGLGMIDPSEGAGRVAEELIHGCKGDVEVIVAGDLGNLVMKAKARAER
ncbi:MAG: SDR family NAD(P)-dependent oxidoreductase [Isosphaeraceae bacterium]